MSMGGWFPFQPPSQEEQREMRAEAERNAASADAFFHGFQRMLEESSEDDLITLRTMLQVVTQRTSDDLACRWHGMVMMALKSRFNICIHCGTNHDNEVPRPEKPLFDKGGTHPLLDLEAMRETLIEQSPGKPPQPFEDRERNSDGTIPFLPEEREIMDEYHLDDSYEEADPPLFLGFRCTGIEGWNKPCGVVYPSLQDRMLNPPEKCSGCQTRMAHG